MFGEARHRESYKLTRTSNCLFVHLSWRPRSVTINNTSKYPAYVRIGGLNPPSNASFSDFIPPFTSYVIDPSGAVDFAVFVDNTTDPNTAFTYPVNVVFSTGAASAQGPLNSNFSTGYIAKVTQVESANCIAMWPLNENAGTVANNSVNANRAGVYQGAPLPVLAANLFADNVNSLPTFTPANGDYVNVFSSGGGVGLADVFSGTECSILFWFKMTLAHLNDANEYTFFHFIASAGNQILVSKGQTAANSLDWRYSGSGAQIGVLKSSFTNTGWNAIMITVSHQGAGRMRAYLNGLQQGVDQVGPGVFVGSLTAATLMALTTGVFRAPDTGGMCAVWNKELTAAEVLTVSTAP